MKRLLLLAALLVASSLTSVSTSRADTSYMLVQGPFGSGSSVLTYKFQVNYPTGDLLTGQDLVNAVFGTPVQTGSYTDNYDNTYAEYTSSEGGRTATYYYVPKYSELLLLGYTINGVSPFSDVSGDPSWYLNVAGGSGEYSGNISSGSWSFSGDGVETRYLADGSYDGWLFGNPGYDTGDGQWDLPADEIDNTSGLDAPTMPTFSGTGATDSFTVISVPEPATAALLAAAGVIAAAVGARKARRE